MAAAALEINCEFAAGWLDYVGGTHAHGCRATASEVAAAARFTLFAQAARRQRKMYALSVRLASHIDETWEDYSQARFGTLTFVLHIAAGRAKQISNICRGS